MVGESVAPAIHPWAVSTILARVASVKAIPTQIMAKAGAEELLSAVWRMRVRVVLHRQVFEPGEGFYLLFYSDFLILSKHL